MGPEVRDLLAHAVFDHREVLPNEVGDGRSGPIEHADIEWNQRDPAAECRNFLAFRRRPGLSLKVDRVDRQHGQRKSGEQ